MSFFLQELGTKKTDCQLRREFTLYLEKALDLVEYSIIKLALGIILYIIIYQINQDLLVFGINTVKAIQRNLLELYVTIPAKLLYYD